MNIQQLQYIVAVDEYRHFQKAAESCFVTPATLSMMVKKLEQELDLTIFDRSKKSVIPTDIGISIIDKAKEVLHHIKEIEHIAAFASEDIAGEVRIAIIPTLAPYLSHLFLGPLMQQYPNLKIKLFEWNTGQIVEGLKHNRLDIGIAATPLHLPEIKELPVFYEKLVAYTAESHRHNKDKQYIVPNEINIDRLWLLEEEHSLRSQVINLCSLKKQQPDELQLEFEAGSIETLLNIVSMNEGITIIPELVVPTLSEKRKVQIRSFANPVPVREVSLLTYRHFVKEKLLLALADTIAKVVAPYLSQGISEQKVIEI